MEYTIDFLATYFFHYNKKNVIAFYAPASIDWGHSAFVRYEVPRVSYFDCAVSVVRRAWFGVRCPSSIVNFLTCVRSRAHIFSLILMKLCKNVCLD